MTEFYPATPEQFSTVKQLIDELLDLGGTEQNLDYTEVRIKTLTIALGKSALVENIEKVKLPTMRLSKSLDDQIKWDYEVSYSVQDPTKSLHILMGQDEIVGEHAIVSDYHANNPDMLSANQAAGLIEDLQHQLEVSKF